MNDDKVRQILTDAGAGVDPPLRRVDHDRLLEHGRRRLRRRRLAQVGASAAAVLGIVGLVGTLSVADQPADQPTAAGPTSAIPPATAPTTPRQFDPLTQTADLGWTPAGLSVRQVRITRTVQEITAFRAPAGGAGPSSGDEITLAVHAPGWAPRPADRPAASDAAGACQRGAPAGQAQGRPAYELANDPNGSGYDYCVGLMWQRADGAWVELRTRGFEGQSRTRLARQVAQAARLDGLHRQVRVPFRVTGRLAGLTVTESSSWTAPAAARAGAPNAGSLTLTNTANRRSVLVLCAATGETTSPQLGAPDTTVDGHPAIVRADQVVVFGVGGCRIQVEGDPAAVAGGGRDQGLVGVYRAVRPVPDPADPSTWTDRPLG